MVRAYLFLAVFIPLTLIFAASALICTFFDNSGRVYAMHARLWSRISLRIAGVRVRIQGLEHIPEGPVIFMSNHQSNFDILTMIAHIPQQIHWIAKKELFDYPVFGASMRRGGYIPLDRSDGRKALKSMENAARIIRSGKSVVMFPEGTRTRDLKLLPFKRGGFMLAQKAGVPVVPVTINGSGRINPAGRKMLHPGIISVTLHPAIMPDNNLSRNEAENRLQEKVHSSISSALES
ncbi:MAG TPA: lysophospholipid acyltransferase family protein [Deltaproteobacteria bacterium]|mgnify:CR=1 FL=1|nr:lysophospholipid acyltransferase family protein [Deltaproteobacteria bacterium]HQB37699.1 lysophospholipid acyltransferase family protein [Deltaproteobacteria bacterium]